MGRDGKGRDGKGREGKGREENRGKDDGFNAFLSFIFCFSISQIYFEIILFLLKF